MRRTLHPWLEVALFATLSFVAMAGPGGPGEARAAAPVIEEAVGLYNEARFSDAITTLRAALASGALAGRDALEAKALLGRCMVKTGDRLEAKEAFKSLLRQNPGWRLDPKSVPPDEVEVFAQAQRELASEQIAAGNRVPASIAFFAGVGSGDNKDLAEMPVAGGGKDTYESETSFGGSVRFPLRPRLSLDIELQRLKATATDTFPESNGGRYEATALPLAVSVYYAAIARTSWRMNVFGGVGPLLAGTSTITFFLSASDRVALADERVGLYAHAGLEGEFLAHPRLALTGRVLGRLANASGLYKDSTFRPYGRVDLADRKLDFSGYGAHLGVRAYIGY